MGEREESREKGFARTCEKKHSVGAWERLEEAISREKETMGDAEGNKKQDGQCVAKSHCNIVK